MKKTNHPTTGQLIIKKLEDQKPDIFVVAAYGKILPNRVLNIPRLGNINIHPSLLPKYRGPSPIQTTLLNGDEKTGVTICGVKIPLPYRDGAEVEYF